MEAYNLEKLVKVRLNNFYESGRYEYKKEKKFFWRSNQKEGVYMSLWGDYLGLEVPENHTLKNGVVYENPEVILYYQGGISKTYYFDTYEKAKDFYNEMTKNSKWKH